MVNRRCIHYSVLRPRMADESRFTTAEETAWGLEACRSWPAAEGMDADGPHEVLDLPTLILMGELDPVIPVENMDMVRSLFPVGPTVVFADTAHSPGPGALQLQGCSVPLMEAFLSGAIIKEADTSCANTIERPDFYIPF